MKTKRSTPRFSVFENRHHYGPNRLSDIIIIADGQMSVWVKQGHFNNPENPVLTPEKQEELAAFIVKACNSHQKTVKLLESMLERYKSLADSGDAGFWDCEQEPLVKKIRAHLAALQQEGAAK